MNKPLLPLDREPTPEEWEVYNAAMMEYNLKAAERKQRRGIVALNLQEIGTLLGLPEGYEAVWVTYNWRTEQMEIGILGDGLDIAIPGCEAPILDKYFDVQECEFGQVHIRTIFPEQEGMNNG